jgi:hypothetical protein
MFEHHKKPLINRREFIHRQIKYTGFSMLVLISSIGIGVMGYHFCGGLSWIDAFLNASMILTGMGQIDHLTTDEGKFFAAFYALFSGISFLTFVAVLFAPLYHRFLHKLHLDIEEEEK